ncbi:FecCD family ABC transporter permease [Crossiella sp. CA198]|uniref:FecCD family ABC transporter permease n=1 Tax=Crossiella sp. CA198 TaxID=3455607 RepID=UPI003F8D0DD7
MTPIDPSARSRGGAVRWGGLVVAVAALVLLCALSISVGARDIPLSSVWQLLWQDDGGDDAFAVHEVRIPRTVLGLLVGAALGLAGALMQALVRNPLADPGLLGVNAGASTAVVLAITLGVSSPSAYVYFAILGAGAVSVAVYLLGSAGRASSPDRLVLAGVALTAALGALVTVLLFLDQQRLDQFRFWAVGSLAGRKIDVVWQLGPVLAIGILLALLMARPLNAVALGETTGRALGVHLGRTRLVTAVAVALLCGAATAAAGPIGFVGLTVPHVARLITGPDQRWVAAYSLLLAPILLLGADIIGRIIALPGELEVGIVTAFLGVPVFLALIQRRQVATL